MIYLKGKTTEIYSNLISCIQDEAEMLNITLTPALIIVDFEQAAIKSFKTAFPSAKIKGCFFHLTNAIYKKVVELGLKVAYSENEDFRIFVTLLMCLPLLPIDEIDESFAELIDE